MCKRNSSTLNLWVRAATSANTCRDSVFKSHICVCTHFNHRQHGHVRWGSLPRWDHGPCQRQLCQLHLYQQRGQCVGGGAVGQGCCCGAAKFAALVQQGGLDKKYKCKTDPCLRNNNAANNNNNTDCTCTHRLPREAPLLWTVLPT